MNDTHVTLHGYVGGDVELRDGGGSPVARFRVAHTPRFQRDGEWVDGETQWYSISCWRTLATNVHASVRKGDAVFVQGRMRSDTWTRQDGSTATGWTVVATVVGHDLNRGRARFARPPRPEGVAQEAGAAQEPVVAQEAPAA